MDASSNCYCCFCRRAKFTEKEDMNVICEYFNFNHHVHNHESSNLSAINHENGTVLNHETGRTRFRINKAKLSSFSNIINHENFLPFSVNYRLFSKIRLRCSNDLNNRSTTTITNTKNSYKKCENFNNNYKSFGINELLTGTSIIVKRLFTMIIMLNMISLLLRQISSPLFNKKHLDYNDSLFFINIGMVKASPGTDAFNIDKLLEYNELVSCFVQIAKEFEHCNKRGAEKAKSFLGQIELSAEWNLRLKCCGTWKLRDCWMKAAHQKCTKAQADMVYKLPSLIMPALVEECQDYTPESGKCNFPLWMIASAGFVILLVLSSCCGCLYYCIQRRHNKRQYRRRGMPPPEQRPYSMTHSQNSIYKDKAAAYQNGGTKMNGVLVPATPHNCNYNHDHDHHDHHDHHHRSNNHHHRQQHRNNNHHHLNHKNEKLSSLEQVDSQVNSDTELIKHQTNPPKITITNNDQTTIKNKDIEAGQMNSGDEAQVALV